MDIAIAPQTSPIPLMSSLSLSDILLKDYVTILLSGNLGDITQDDWERLQEEADDLSGGAKLDATVTTTAEIEMLNIRIGLIALLIHNIRVYGWDHSEPLIEALKGLSPYPGKLETIEELEYVENHSKQYNSRIAELMKALPKVADNKAPTKASFMQMVIAIVNWFKVPLSYNTISAAEFFIQLKIYNEAVEQHNRNMLKNPSGSLPAY